MDRWLGGNVKWKGSYMEKLRGKVVRCIGYVERWLSEKVVRWKGG